jgi:hypothetical protein
MMTNTSKDNPIIDYQSAYSSLSDQELCGPRPRLFQSNTFQIRG